MVRRSRDSDTPQGDTPQGDTPQGDTPKGDKPPPPGRIESAMDLVSRVAFGIASLVLMAMSAALVGFAAIELANPHEMTSGDFGDALLRAIGYVVIAVAVFDLAKYFFQEEVVRGRELRIASEARRSLTKFISTISIAVFIEALVTVVRVSKQDVERMIYPNLLLLTAVAMVVGLGVYQRLSATIERRDQATGHDPAIPDARDERAARAAVESAMPPRDAGRA